jgi:hypothetical protein
MIALRFHRSVYDGRAVDEAVKLFAAHATFQLREEPEYWVVELEAAPERERRIAGELGNYALGLTVKSGVAS